MAGFFDVLLRGLTLAFASVALGGVAWTLLVLGAEAHVKPDAALRRALRTIAVGAAGGAARGARGAAPGRARRMARAGDPGARPLRLVGGAEPRGGAHGGPRAPARARRRPPARGRGVGRRPRAPDALPATRRGGRAGRGPGRAAVLAS